MFMILGCLLWLTDGINNPSIFPDMLSVVSFGAILDFVSVVSLIIILTASYVWHEKIRKDGTYKK